MTTQHITSPEDQSASFIELFFDLVRVIGLTLYIRAASGRGFALFSRGGLVAALAGALREGEAQSWLWG